MRIHLIFLGLVSVLLFTGCASNPHTPEDPWEDFNRKSFAFNEGLDTYLLKPVAKGYDTITPRPVRIGISNFFGNLGDLWIGGNNLLQGKPKDAASDIGRFFINTTIGIFGLIDVATPMGIEKHNEDFGQTLAVWGVGDGPYVVLPVLGPRTLRDSGALTLDISLDPLSNLEPVRTRNGLIGLRFVDVRAELLSASDLLEQAALDKYTYLRSAYLQRRRNLIFDGNPPREEFFDE